MDAPPQFPPGTIIGGDFRIQRPLSQGGMGAVYVAEQVSTGKPRALKLMHPQLVTDPKSRVRFIDEARVGSKIPSEHVVEVVGAGVDEPSGVPYLAMELLEGEDLSSVVQRSGALPAASVRELMLQLGHALGAAHERGIVHRDLKPENVFVARSRRRGAELTVKVLDFGIAKTLSENRTAATSTSAMGSPMFMAPEQATPGAAIRAQTDVWALGLIAFHALTGRYYWRSAEIEPFSLHALLAEVLVHPLPTAHERARELGASATLPPGFDGWFARCVARDPGGRFPEASACVAAFESMMQGNLHPSSQGQIALASTLAMPSSPGVSTAPGHATPSGPGFGSTPAPVGPTAYMHASPPPHHVTYAKPAATSSSGVGLLIAGLVAGVGLLLVGGLVVAGVALRPREAPSQPIASSSPVVFAPPSPIPPAPVPEPLPPPEPIAPSPPIVAAPTDPTAPTGRLQINTMPWSNVFIDGRAVGQTPVMLEVPAGAHRVRLVTSAGTTVEESVTVEAGEVSRITRRMDEAPAAAPVERAPPSQALPSSPSRGDIVAAMNGVSPAVSACSDGTHGVVPVRFTFAGSTGRVTSATVTGSFPAPVSGCIARAARGATVPPFSQPSFSVNYPFRI